MGNAKPRLSKKAYQTRASRLREQLVQLQVELKEGTFKVMLILAGPEGAGRGNLLNTLAEWLDPRGVETFSYHAPTDNERAHPHQWRFWRSLPAIGRIGLHAGSWYTETLRDEARSKSALSHVAREAERTRDFENPPAEGGTLIVKVWLHLSKEARGRRLRPLRAAPATAWRVTDEDWHHHRIHGRLAKTARLIRAKTDRPGAHWNLVDAEDERVRDLEVGRLLLTQFKQQQKRFARLERTRAPRRVRSLRPSGLRRLRALPLDQDLSEQDHAALRATRL